MIKIVDRKEIVKYLKDSYSKWELPEEEKHLSDDFKSAKKAVAGSSDYEFLLSKTISDTQLDWVLDNAEGNKKQKLFSNDVAITFTNKSNELREKKVNSPLPLEIFLELHGIDIPDSSKDKLEFEFFIHVSTKKEKLLHFLQSNKFIHEEERLLLQTKWDGEDYYVESDREKFLIDKVLDIDLEGYYDKKLKEQQYQLQFDDASEICYSKRIIYTFKNLLETDSYPFDDSPVQLMLALTSNFDSSEIEFKPMSIKETIKTSVFVPDTFYLRGFYVDCKQRDVICAGFYQDAGSYMQNAAMLEFRLIRNTSAFFWRSFIPVTIITCIVLISSILAAFQSGFKDSVMHQVIPTLLISIVGVQYNTSLYLPFRAGKTKIDLFFVQIYFSILLSYVSLVLLDLFIPFVILFCLSIFLAVYSILQVLFKNNKHEIKRKSFQGNQNS
jgi:hypothetical protein